MIHFRDTLAKGCVLQKKKGLNYRNLAVNCLFKIYTYNSGFISDFQTLINTPKPPR